MRLTAPTQDATDAAWRDEVEDFIRRWNDENEWSFEALADSTGRSGAEFEIEVWDGGDKIARFEAEPLKEFQAWIAEREAFADARRMPVAA